MTALNTYRPTHLPGLVAIWNRVFESGPDFIPLTEADLIGRVISQPSFAPQSLLVAGDSDRVAGFVHFGPLTNFWHQLRQRRPDYSTGQIWALVAPPSDPGLARALLDEALGRLASRGARRVLLYPSWVQCTQPFYNCIAGAYEYPGLSAARTDLLDLAADLGFTPAAEYATPQLDLSDAQRLSALRADAARVWDRLRDSGLQPRRRIVTSSFFADRRAVEFTWGLESVATTAYGLWEEYARARRRRLYGITGVQVSQSWRGLGLGKLILIRALEAALDEGAEALHLHVYKDNHPAWNLYHRALGFQPRHTWLTLAKQLP